MGRFVKDANELVMELEQCDAGAYERGEAMIGMVMKVRTAGVVN
jgi:hypothetical protein